MAGEIEATSNTMYQNNAKNSRFIAMKEAIKDERGNHWNDNDRICIVYSNMATTE